jgi:hypothetical protein
MIVEAMYNYIKDIGMKLDEYCAKFTQLLDSQLCKSSQNDLSLQDLLLFHFITYDS